jgi:GNAT superfamily N-acetyltransferase
VGVSVRVAGAEDLGALTRLRRTWTEENSGAPINDDTFDAAFRAWWEAERATRTFFVVDLDEVAIAMANVKRYDRMPVPGRSSGHWGYVGNVFVVPEHRNHGVGAALMHALEEWAWSAGMAHLRLAPAPLSATFYVRLGYVAGSVVELDPSTG